ncbi:DUF3857 domain-containing protein [Aquimarina litoralis]|uniref:DUF3857 domain-containing protein n=1 Tax=Aquimarina litoralis TaxID=584605 RepID=UPI001C58F010|nr:DUF3857 domain-containing protein [Aquimarina litoralis]MBW1298931.1 DUF3857 domain-containing protein [Aquimarina litoralis]
MLRNGFMIMVFLLSFGGQAQNTSPLFKEYKAKYPDDYSVKLLEERNVDIRLKNGEILITQEVLEENLYLDAAATYQSKQSINYSTFLEVESIEAASMVYENGKYNTIEVEDFVTKDEMDQSFYDDSKSINFIYPNLQPGSKSKLKYKEKIKNPRFLGTFFFADFHPTVKSKLTITVDKNISIKFKDFNIGELPINFSKSEKRGKQIYTWEVNQMDKFEIDPGAPNFRNTLPHLIPMITEYESKGEKVKVLGEIADLYGWYYSLVKDINESEPDQELQQIVQKLTKDKKTDLEKVKAIYYWVQENIKYIAFEYALGGFVPRQANDVFNKKYGDCKDNSSILQEMLEIAGLKGNLTWIGTRSIPYKYEEVPTPAVDNHMILTYIDGNDVYYLDATGRYIPIDLPTSFIQGKEALIAVNENEFDIKEVPVIDAKRNALVDSTYIKIEDQTIKGTGSFNLSGYSKIDFFNAFERAKKEENLKSIYTRELRKGSNKFLIESFEEINKYDYEKDFTINYSFNIKDYMTSLDDETYINLNLNKEISRFKLKKDRKSAREYRYKSYTKNVTVLEIPEDKTVSYIPESFSISNDFFECSITYTKKASAIVYELEMNQNFILLDISQQKEFNKLIKKIEKNFKEVVILKDKK